MSLAFWNPTTVFAGFDDDFITDPIVPSTLLGIPPTITNFETAIMSRSSPRCEVTDDQKQFQLSIDAPGVKPDSMQVELQNDGRILHVSGGHKARTDTSYREYTFDKCFRLGNDLETSEFTAHLSDGVLVVTAPKKEVLPPVKREIAIVQGEAPTLTDEEGEKKG